jgi:hypothetical protein
MPTPPRALSLAILLALPLGAAACSDGSFSGSNGAPAPSHDSGSSADGKVTTDQDANAAGADNQPQQIDANAKGGPGSDQPDQSDTDASKTGQETNTDGSANQNGIDTDKATVTGSIKKEITFGLNEVFHIGDGQYAQTACKARVQSYTLTGASFRFGFTVLTDATTVTISISTICGLNQGYGDFAALEGPNGELQHLKMTPATYENKVLSFQAATLAKGDYAIHVYSGFGQANPSDRDDFIVGNITIKGSSDVKQGEITHSPN